METQSATRSLLLLKFSTVSATLALFAIRGLKFAPGDALAPLLLCMGLAVTAAIYRSRAPAFVLCCLSLIALVAFSTVFPMMTYAIGTTDRPLVDSTLQSADSAFGFSAGAVVNWVHERPIVSSAFTIAYFSIIPQTALVVIYLGLTNSRRQLSQFLLQFILCALITAVCFYFMPAKGTVATFDVPVPEYYKGVLRDLDALRSGAMTIISWRGAEGIITFPSFHTIWGILIVVAFIGTRLLWPIVALNVMMIASTVPIGMHYFVDILGAVFVCALVIPATRWVHVPQRCD